MKLIVGLGNPGDSYSRTRHNLGFLVLDHLAKRHKIAIDIKKKKSLIGKMRFNNEKIIILKPQTFINLSGEAVLYMASFLRIKPQDIIVVCDDANLKFGEVSVKKYGSSGGHNGIKSLIKFLKADDFPRVRIGIGKPENPQMPLEAYVLGSFSKEEIKRLIPTIDTACDLIEKILTGEIDQYLENEVETSQLLVFP